MKALPSGQIGDAVDHFIGRSFSGPEPAYADDRRRETSYDFAYNYFQQNDYPTERMQESCMQLGYYLASWGMLRGSTYLFKRTNARHYRSTIELIEDLNPTIRGVDADKWSEVDVQEQLIECFHRLQSTLLPEGGTPGTLVTKVMLGVWGCVPAYDTNFRTTFRGLAESKRDAAAFNTFGRRSLAHLASFYEDHAKEIDGLAGALFTRDFDSNAWTDTHLSRAKIIDMFAYQYSVASPSS